MSSWEEIENLLYRAITGGRSPHTEGFQSAVRELRRQVDTTAEMARRLGIPRRTVGDWLNKGVQPKPAHRQTVMEALRRHRLRLGRESRLKGGAVRIVAYQRYTEDDRDDNVRVWVHPRGGSPYNISWDSNANRSIIDAYLAGDMRAAAQAFIDGIGDPGYRDMTDPDQDTGDPGEPFFDILSIELE